MAILARAHRFASVLRSRSFPDVPRIDCVPACLLVGREKTKKTREGKWERDGRFRERTRGGTKRRETKLVPMFGTNRRR